MNVRPRVVALGSFAFVALIAAISACGEPGAAEIWDDAMFFKRSAYNVLHHGFAGWNQADGPVYVNTSQLYQFVAVLLLWVAPAHFNVAVILWGWVCLLAAFALLVRVWREPSSATVLSAFMLSPPLFLCLSSGMETATAVLVLAAFFSRTLEREVSFSEQIAWQLLVYLVRPDALLLSLMTSVVATIPHGGWRSAVRLVVGVSVGLSALLLASRAYYGTALPLAFFLKTSQVSVYDAAYLSLGRDDKARNLAQLALISLPLIVLGLGRRDRQNIALLSAALAFVAYHALSTFEVMGYHARFYLPALVAIAVAAMRGVTNPEFVARKPWFVATVFLSAAVAAAAWRNGWIENADGFPPSRAMWWFYAAFFACALVVALPARVGPLAISVVAILLAVVVVPESWSPTSDELANSRNVARYKSSVGVDRIARCFPQPFTLMHSELGIPGVMFLESRIVDFTGLANRDVTEGRFDFERICDTEQPEFVFRPHWTHKRLNELLSQSPCFSSRYVEAKLSRPSSCPLFVRRDLIEKFDACASPN